MKVAALYDIHGNLPALEAVLADVDRLGCDLILVGGDVAYGPMPHETIALLMALGEKARFIRGNSDREVVARFDALHATDSPPTDPADEHFSKQITTWTSRQLDRDQRNFLAALPERLTIDIDGLGPTLFCHGSPRSDEEILTRATPEERLRDVLAGVTEPVVVCGHTHVQFDRRAARKRVVNAGSVGMPYEGRPGAYWAHLGPDVELRRTVYDFDAAAAAVRATGVPGAGKFAAANVLRSPSAEEATAQFERLAEERAASDERQSTHRRPSR